jgi:uncharacterized protein
MENKLRCLRDILSKMGRVAIAISGGIDSAFLLRVAAEVIPGWILALTAVSIFLPEEDLKDAKNIARQTQTAHHLIDFNPLEVPHFAENSAERCYYCKKTLCRLFLNHAGDLGITNLIDGTNADDLKDFRPGLKAAVELSVRSPLSEANLTKAGIRALSQQLGISLWNKPSSPCLATRFPYGQSIVAETVERVKKAEGYLKNLGYNPVRVRSYRDTARIETEAGQIGLFMEQDRTEHITGHLQELGFTYVTLDMEGYKSKSPCKSRNNVV